MECEQNKWVFNGKDVDNSRAATSKPSIRVKGPIRLH